LRILMLGGTRFVGRHIAQALLAQGHALTLFHRGQSGPDLFPAARHVRGDRDQGFDTLGAGTWDAVIDTSAYFPRQVRGAHAALAGRAGRLVFVSTISVYAEPLVAPVTEDSPLAPADFDAQAVTAETYGGLKAGCEAAVAQGWGDAAWVLRPGLVVGPHDPTGRFGHWVAAMRRNTPFAGPPRLAQPLQVLDARDLGAFVAHGLATGAHGTMQVAGERGTFAALFALGQASWPQARPLPPEPGAEDLPLVLPADGTADALLALDCARARVAGFAPRPLAQTLAACAAAQEDAGSWFS